MVATPDEIKAMETFFQSVKLEKVFVLHNAITFNDLPKYVNQVIEGLKSNQMTDTVARPRWEDLVTIRKILENK